MMFVAVVLSTVLAEICRVENVPAITDTTTLARYATDWSYRFFEIPRCAFQPRSARDVRDIMRFARDHSFKVAVQGQAHSNNGQSLTNQQGITIDTSLLNTLTVEPACSGGNDDVDDDDDAALAHSGCFPIATIVSGAGNKWETVTSAGFAAGYRVVGHVDSVAATSIGGTLSIGSLNALSLRLGPGVQHVVELLVVTGDGEVKRCSVKHNERLFRNVLGGLGLFAVIVEARIELQPLVPLAPLPVAVGGFSANVDTPAHVYQLTIIFFDAGTYHDQLVALSNNLGVDGLESFILPNSPSQVALLLGKDAANALAAVLMESGAPYLYLANIDDIAPASFDVNAYLGSLRQAGVQFAPVIDAALNYQSWASRQDQFLSLAETSGIFSSPKAVGNVYLPNSAGLRNFFVAVMAELSTPAFLASLIPGSGYSGAYTPIDSRVVTSKTNYRLPLVDDDDRRHHEGASPLVFNFDLNWLQSGQVTPLQGQAPAAQEQQGVIDNIMQRAVRIFDDATFYPYTNPPYCWRRHFGSKYDEVKSAKEEYDPHHLLGNSYGIFPQRYNSGCHHDDDDDNGDDN